MKKDRIMVRYGELSTKGKNRKNFIDALAKNIKRMLKDFERLTYEVRRDHIYIELNDESCEQIEERLKKVPGLYSFSYVYRLDNNLEEMKKAALEILLEEKKKTFKVRSKRTDKSFPYVSDEINRAIAGYVLTHSDYKVDVHQPEILLSLTVREDYTYLYTSDIRGLGGYPLGIQGKAMMMLSGGIDSPVACYYMLKRGIKIECVHFASPPYTAEGVITKIKNLLEVLNIYQEKILLHIVPFTKLQEEIYRVAGTSYAITIMRRMMYRIAESLAEKRNCFVLGNGESIGQVASQTLVSLKEIERVTHLPVIRPLACVDKVDIIETAKQIGTYDISIRPFEDCCTIFEPKNVTTAPHPNRIEKIENSFDWKTLVEECIENIETMEIEKDKKEDHFF